MTSASDQDLYFSLKLDQNAPDQARMPSEADAAHFPRGASFFPASHNDDGPEHVQCTAADQTAGAP